MTELETINKMLSAAGLAPVADMNTQHPSYKRAKLILDDVSRTVQMQGYWFNRAVVTLRRDIDGYVVAPAQATHVNTISTVDADVVLRGNKLYDLVNRTYIFDRDIECNIVEVLDFELLPTPVAAYVAARAVHEFYLAQGGQDPKLSEYRNLRAIAEIDFKKEALKNHRPAQKSYTRFRFTGNPMRSE